MLRFVAGFPFVGGNLERPNFVAGAVPGQILPGGMDLFKHKFSFFQSLALFFYYWQREEACCPGEYGSEPDEPGLRTSLDCH